MIIILLLSMMIFLSQNINSKLIEASNLHGDEFIISNRIHKIKFTNNIISSYKQWTWNSKNKDPSIFNFQTGVLSALSTKLFL